MRVAAVVVLFAVGPAAADDFGTPKPSRIDARLDADTARFTVRYLVRADGSGEGHYALPDRGLVVGATASEGGRRHVLNLVDAEQARTEFAALWEAPPALVRTRAVLVEAQPYTNELTITPAIPRGASLVVDLEVQAPTCFHRDARYLAVPSEWVSRLPVAMRVAEAEGEAVGETCTAAESGSHAWVKFPARALAARPSGAERIGTYAARTTVGATSFVKLELNLAARLSDVPADLATAIVIDASRSLTTDELAAQRQTIAAYLRAAPHGRVQVIAYARRARALLPSWTTATQATPRIERALQTLTRSNGSDIAEGLREAGRWLGQTTGTRRIVLFTDEHLSIRDEHTRAVDDAVPANTLVHVVALGGDGLARDDEAKLARVAANTRGLSVRGGDIGDDAKLDATLLVRPISLDHVRVRTPGWTALDTRTAACPEDDTASFPEGGQCTWWGSGDAVASPFVVEGWLWGERVERVVRADLARSLDVVRELSAMRVLEDELQKLAERAARAVSSVWSLYAAWGGNGGYSDGDGIAGFVSGSVCGCSIGTIGHGFGTGTLGPKPDLAGALAEIVQTCKPSQLVDVEVETTLEEIVDVEVKAVSAELRTCVEEALWNAWLVVPGAPQRTITRLSVSPT